MTTFTVIEPWRFEAITPSQYITFTMPNILNHRRLLSALVLRFAVLDSPTAKADDESPVIAAMIVPKNRETDWMFCSESGHLQILLKSPHVSRLILISNNPPAKPGLAVYKRPPATDTIGQEMLERELKPLLMSMHPQVNFNRGLPDTQFLKYEDDVAYRVTVAKYKGSIVGEFLVEDVELVGNTDANIHLRRRLRFERIPSSSEAFLVPIIGDNEVTAPTDLESLRKIEKIKFEADTTLLVHKYHISMVAGLSLIVSHLKKRFDQGFLPSALCLGIGGGVLLNFLETQMGFVVTGVEADETLIAAATQHFGFNKSETMRLIEEDAIEAIQSFPPRKPGVNSDGKFDIVFVDLYSSEVTYGFGAPPPEFVQKRVFQCFRSILDEHGALIIHVIPLSEKFYSTLVIALKRFFHNVYKIGTKDKNNFVLVGIVSPTSSNSNADDNIFLKRLKTEIPGTYMDSIVKL